MMTFRKFVFDNFTNTCMCTNLPVCLMFASLPFTVSLLKIIKETPCSSVMANHAGLCTPTYIMYATTKDHSGNNYVPCHDNKEADDTPCYIMILCCFTALVGD